MFPLDNVTGSLSGFTLSLMFFRRIQPFPDQKIIDSMFDLIRGIVSQ